MATHRSSPSSDGNYKAVTASWGPMAPGDDTSPISLREYSDRSVQVSGAFGGATISIQGSIDNLEWSTLTDGQGNPLTFTSGRIEAIAELVAYVKPVLAGGDGTTSITVSLIARKD